MEPSRTLLNLLEDSRKLWDLLGYFEAFFNLLGDLKHSVKFWILLEPCIG